MSSAERRAKAQQIEDRRHAKAIQNGVLSLLESSDGRELLCRLIFVEAKLHWPSYTRGLPDETAYREGQRSIGMMLNDLAKEADMRAYLVMLDEHEQSRRPAKVEPSDEGE